MAGKKKDKKILVKVSDLDDEKLDKKLDEALDALFGPDEEDTEENKPATRKAPAKQKSKGE